MPRTRPTYRGANLALLVPTKDRPEKVRNLLDSLAAQTVLSGRVLIIDGGEGIEDLVVSYRGKLPVEYHRGIPPGQIRQRNLGLAQLDDATPLVGFLDDDLVFLPEAVEAMVDFWNRAQPEPAGVAFNIVNEPANQYSWIFGLLCMSSKWPGRVLASGRNVSISNVPEDMPTQWLGGGYTVWRRDILTAYPQESLKTKWAVGEDLRFSYPIGKKHPFYVCCGAKVRHEKIIDQAPPGEVHRYRGRKEALATYLFASSHPELSRLASLWMLAGSSLVIGLYSLLKGNEDVLQMSLGRAGAVVTCLKSLLGLVDIRAELED